MRVDSHQHFWRYDPAQYPWIESDWPIRKDFLPEDLAPILECHQIAGTIAVQARQSWEETSWLLELAGQFDWIFGVVGWIDLRAKTLPQQLSFAADNQKLVGFRHVVQDETDPTFLLRQPFIEGIRALESQGRFAYDLLIYHHQLASALQFVEQFPKLRIILDHLAKPDLRKHTKQPWTDQIRQLGQSTHVACKISGLITEAEWSHWKEDDLIYYLEVVWEAFGPKRLLFGSDWPVMLLSGSYKRWLELLDHWIQSKGQEEADGFWGANAMRWYQVKRSSGLEVSR
jgi:L-fuconolactonase